MKNATPAATEKTLMPTIDTVGTRVAEYAGNYGEGPLMSRITRRDAESVHLEYWHSGVQSPRIHQVTLAASQFESSAWKKIGGGT